jgi:uncharacterized membrane protein YfcA
MHLTLTQFSLVAVILLASSVLQGAVGFASGLFGIPLLMLIGMTLPEAVAISLVSSAVQNCVATWQLRREIDYRRALRPMLIRLATLPLGVLALVLVGRENNALASQMVGVVVLAIVFLQWAFQATPQPRLHPAWEWVAFGCGGFLLGLCGMGGPPMVLWTMAHDWPMVRAKAFLYYLFATGLPPQAFFLWLFFGNEMLVAMLIGLLTLPFLLVGLYIGLALATRFSDRTLRGLATATLVLIAISAILTPWLK